MLIATIRHGRDGARLVVSDAPLWALAAEAAAESACSHLRHALCQGTWPIGYRLGQWLLSPAARREQERWSTPLTAKEVHQTFPESVFDLDEE